MKHEGAPGDGKRGRASEPWAARRGEGRRDPLALEAQRVRGRSAADSIYEACVVRFRPIMMTTLAALAGTLPIALGWGAGAESRRTLGLAVVGGLLVSQLLTLYITPVFYLYMERFTKLISPKPVPAPALAGAQTT